MRIRSANGSKERLMEMMIRVNHLAENTFNVISTEKPIVLSEQQLPIEKKKDIIKDFIDFVCGKFNLDENKLPKIQISYVENEAEKQRSFGGYMPQTETIRVVGKNRNLADVLRTLGHELVHHKQKINNELNQDSGTTGSDAENEANSLAGVLLREFGQANPIIFE